MSGIPSTYTLFAFPDEALQEAAQQMIDLVGDSERMNDPGVVRQTSTASIDISKVDCRWVGVEPPPTNHLLCQSPEWTQQAEHLRWGVYKGNPEDISSNDTQLRFMLVKN